MSNTHLLLLHLPQNPVSYRPQHLTVEFLLSLLRHRTLFYVSYSGADWADGTVGGPP
jgi:hypothetical protein